MTCSRTSRRGTCSCGSPRWSPWLTGLIKVGFLKWFAGGAAGALSGYSVMTIVLALTVVYFVVHYMFASLTAHTTALLPVLLTAAIAVPECRLS